MRIDPQLVGTVRSEQLFATALELGHEISVRNWILRAIDFALGGNHNRRPRFP